jgi:hypothetical protein
MKWYRVIATLELSPARMLSGFTVHASWRIRRPRAGPFSRQRQLALVTKLLAKAMILPGEPLLLMGTKRPNSIAAVMSANDQKQTFERVGDLTWLSRAR